MEKSADRLSVDFEGIGHSFPEDISSWRVRESQLHDPRRKKDYNRQLFSIVAPRYDVVTRVLSAGSDRRWKRRILRMLPSRVTSAALDIATGTGDIAEALATKYPNTRIIALDLNPEMLARAKARLRRFAGRIDILEADMAEMPLETASVSVVTGGYALRNAPALTNAVSEIARVLVPGGRAVFLEFSRSPHPIVFALQFRLLRFWGQLWGLLLHGDPEVYAYIARSLSHFPDRNHFHTILENCGLDVMRSTKLYLGLLELTVARRRR
ncbi:MAG: class I SAM-dependent methyltransferase [Spirochaetales bacterium]